MIRDSDKETHPVSCPAVKTTGEFYAAYGQFENAHRNEKDVIFLNATARAPLNLAI